MSKTVVYGVVALAHKNDYDGDELSSSCWSDLP